MTSCAHRDFGDEALRAARAWRFVEARSEGRWVGVVGDMDFEFVADGPLAIEP